MDTPPPPPHQQPPQPDGYQHPYPPPRKKNNVVWIILAVVLVCGCGGVILIPAILFPVFQQAKVAAKRTACISNMKRIAIGEIMYSTDYDDRLPFTKNWQEGISPYVKDGRVYRCPGLPLDGDEGYAMNASHNGKESVKIDFPQTEIAFYETSDLRKNAAGDPKAEPNPDRHGKGRTEAYADAHAAFVKGG